VSLAIIVEPTKWADFDYTIIEERYEEKVGFLANFQKLTVKNEIT
jgi:hypothetical protein